MRPPLLLAGVVAALSAAPALADNGQILDLNAHREAYPAPTLIQYRGELARHQCFDGKTINGISRDGPTTIYVQAASGGIFRLKMKDECAALDAATKVTMKVYGNYSVCEHAAARVIAHTPDGEKFCKVTDVHSLTSKEVAELQASGKR
jgi:hypothetical protein